MELFRHELVEVGGGLKLVVHQTSVLVRAHFFSSEFEDAGSEHVAQELDGSVGAFGEFAGVEANAIEAIGSRIPERSTSSTSPGKLRPLRRARSA